MIKVLALDISAKTGYSVGTIDSEKKLTLLEHGQCKQRKNTDFKQEEPFNMMFWAFECFSDLKAKIEEHKPDFLVVEQTCAGSRSQESQRLLEWIHYFMVDYLWGRKREEKELPLQYYLTGQWRSIVGCKMTKEQKKQNQEVKKQNAKGQKIAKSESGKRIGKVGKKHVNVMKANEYFGLSLKLKDNDIADSLLLLYAFYLENKNGSIAWKAKNK